MSPTPTTGTMTPALQPGDKLGYFDVQEPLGAGGMSLIWKGRDSLLGREVAIKQLADGSQIDEAARERFRAEADIQKKLSEQSEYLVQVIDLIDEPRGLFIVMEYIDGASLEHALQSSDSPMDPRQGLNLVYCLALALKQIHDGGILHRDLKPANILLQRDGRVKVGDFGLATVIEDQDPLTMGTTRYMAPELFGEDPADARSDIYALGMIAYEVLAGRGQFNKAFRTVLRDERHQAMRWMKWHTNQRLHAPPLRTVNSKVPEALSDLVTRMLSKDPSQRIATADQLVEVIKRNFTASGQAMGKVKSTPESQAMAEPVADENPTAPLPKRSKLPLLLAINAVVLLAIIGGGVWYVRSYLPHQAQEKLRTAALARLNEGMQLYTDKQYDQAIEIFREIARDWPNDPQLGNRAMIGGHMSKAYLRKAEGLAAMGDGDFAAAIGHYQGAHDSFESAENVPGRPPLTEINAMKGQMVNSRERARALSDIQQLIQDDAFNKARQEIGRLREDKLTEQQLTELERGKLALLSQQLEQRITKAHITATIEQANQLLAEGKSGEALELLEKTRKQHSTDEKLNKMIVDITSDIRYRATLAEARQAENARQYAQAITLYQQTQAIQHSADTEARIRKLRARQALEQGMGYMTTDNFDAAAQQFIKAKGWDPTLTEADEMLKKINVTNTRQRLIDQAESAYAAREYTMCISTCDQILAMGSDADIQQLKNMATLRQSCNEARAAMDEDKLAPAKAKIDRALVIDAADVQANVLLEEYNDRVQYNRYVEAGDAHRAKGEFGSATMAYRNARTVAKQSSAIPIEPIQQRLDNTDYESWMAKARSSIEARLWVEAMGQLKAAERIRDTDEVRKLKVKVQQELDQD